MKIFVTGSNGFIGSALVASLTRQGKTVHVLCRSCPLDELLENDRVKIFRGNILQPREIREALHGCDQVYHLAAHAKNWSRDKKVYFRVNVTGTQNVLEAAMVESVDRVVFTSSAVTLGPSDNTPLSESSERLRTWYTEYEHSKCQAEKLVQQYVEAGMDIVTVNPTRIFGPGRLSESNSVTKMIDWYIQGKWHLILGNGRAVGNYSFADDVVDGHIRAMLLGKTGHRYILGGENVSYNHLFSMIAEISRTHKRLVRIPSPAALGFSGIEAARAVCTGSMPLITPGWVRTFLDNWEYSSDKAQQELGYHITPFHIALKKTIDWLIDRQTERS